VSSGNEDLEQAVALITAYELDGPERCREVLKFDRTTSDEELILALAGIARMLASVVARSGATGAESTQEVLQQLGGVDAVASRNQVLAEKLDLRQANPSVQFGSPGTKPRAKERQNGHTATGTSPGAPDMDWA
jgi:hypothetical protein